MGKFVVGIVIGISTTLLYFELTGSYESKSTKQLLQPRNKYDTNTSPVSNTGVELGVAVVIDKPLDLESQSTELNNDNPKFTESTSPEVSKADVVALLENLSERDFVRAKRLINSLNARSPEAAFSDEPVDLVWASQAQADLEYSFYGSSPLKDIGALESITCKSKHCRVLVEVPADSQIQTSTLIAWADPRSVNIRPGNTSGVKVVELYILRKRLADQ